jgi:hypothetical protein
VGFMEGSRWIHNGNVTMQLPTYGEHHNEISSVIVLTLLLLSVGVSVGPAETPNFTIRHAPGGRSCIMSYRLV